MRCPKCQNMDSKVVDSRMIEEGQVVRRRRECEFCSHRFTTFERVGVVELIVVKKDWTKEMYDRAKLKRAVMLAFAKRAIHPEEIDKLISSLEIKWQSESPEIPSKQIWSDILTALKGIDPVVYVRFASVYQDFDSFEDFKRLIA